MTKRKGCDQPSAAENEVNHVERNDENIKKLKISASPGTLTIPANRASAPPTSLITNGNTDGQEAIKAPGDKGANSKPGSTGSNNLQGSECCIGQDSIPATGKAQDSTRQERVGGVVAKHKAEQASSSTVLLSTTAGEPLVETIKGAKTGLTEPTSIQQYLATLSCENHQSLDRLDLPSQSKVLVLGSIGEVQISHVTNYEAEYIQTGDNSTMMMGQETSESQAIQTGRRSRTTTVAQAGTELQKLIDKSQLEVDMWVEHERGCVVDTAAIRKCQELLQDKGHLNILGVTGQGKTTMAYDFIVRSGRTPIILRGPGQWELIDVTVKDQIVMIDDMFGRHGLDIVARSGWLKKLTSMYAAVCSSNVQIVTTCREHIFVPCQGELRDYKLFQTNTVHLSSPVNEVELVFEEKIAMLRKHIDCRSPRIVVIQDGNDELSEGKISESTLREIAAIDTPLGFPQCCHFFVTNPNCFKKGVDFFKHPIEVTFGVIEHMSKSDDDREIYNYFTLACVLLCGGSIEQIDANDPKLIDIATACRVPTVTLGSLLTHFRLATERLESSYIKCTHTNPIKFSFKHSSITEAVFTALFRLQTQLVIDHCEYGLLSDLIGTGNGVGDDLTSLCLLPERWYEPLCVRLTREIVKNSPYGVTSHRVFGDKNFVDKFWSYLQSCPDIKRSILESVDTSSQWSILFASACDSYGYFVEKLVEALKTTTPASQLENALSEALSGATVHDNNNTGAALIKYCGKRTRACQIREAAKNGTEDIVRHLLKLPDTYLSKDDIEWAMCEACSWNYYTIYVMLVEQDPNAVTDVVLWEAARGGSHEIAFHLLNKVNRVWSTAEISKALCGACYWGKADVVRLLVGYDTTAVSDQALRAAASGGAEHILRYLLNIPDREWTTGEITVALCGACSGDRHNTYTILVEHDACAVTEEVLKEASRKGSKNIIRDVLQIPDRIWNRCQVSEALLEAVYWCNYYACLLLVEHDQEAITDDVLWAAACGARDWQKNSLIPILTGRGFHVPELNT